MDQVIMTKEPTYDLAPIFILGTHQRSGTNFLRNLLVLHPSIGNGRVLWEDFLLFDSDLLMQYAKSAYKKWPPHWKVEEKIGSYHVLFKHLGLGIQSFLNLCAAREGFGQIGLHHKNPDDIKMLVTKTPSVKGIGNFFNLFPKAHLIVIVRDGRAVVESGIRSFGWQFETAIRAWNEQITTLIPFVEDADRKNEDCSFLIVRFEDLLNNLRGELEKILAFLGVSAEKYDFDGAENLPISGSSDLANKEGKVNWDFREKDKTFKPSERFQGWGRAKHERFNWIVDDKNFSYFGYCKKKYHTHQHIWNAWNRIMDKVWQGKTLFYFLKRKCKEIVTRHSALGSGKIQGATLNSNLKCRLSRR